MRIDIDGTYGITSDKRQYILGKWSTYTNKDGEEIETMTDKTYHTSFEHLFKTYCEKQLRTEEGIDSLGKVVNKINQLKNIIKDLSINIDVNFNENM
jgi:hypothetical protein